jgi:hypothetical protein
LVIIGYFWFDLVVSTCQFHEQRLLKYVPLGRRTLVNEINRPDAWLSSTLSALRAAEDERYDEAALLWGDACAFANRLSNDDPRRAAALNNLGLSEFLAGHTQRAAATLSAARDHWKIVQAWAQRIDIPSTASSSMFHFLLAANHPDALARLRRNKYLTLCAGAAAITDSIYDQARGGTSGSGQLETQIQAIQAAFGEDAAEAHALLALKAHPLKFNPVRPAQSVEGRWRAVSKNTIVEMRPLVDAAYLTIGLKRK